jgi:hypothetical protein
MAAAWPSPVLPRPLPLTGAALNRRCLPPHAPGAQPPGTGVSGPANAAESWQMFVFAVMPP